MIGIRATHSSGRYLCSDLDTICKVKHVWSISKDFWSPEFCKIRSPGGYTYV
jgi:hypothetical protein